MQGRGDTQWFGKLKRRRRATALVLLLTVFVLVAVATRRGWRREYGQDPNRLGLLYEAWTEFNARRYDAATATLDRRASEVAPTALDWMLRARIAEQEGRLEDALDQLKHIPDSDRIGAQARLKAGQIELARHRARAAEAAYLRSIALDPDQVQPYRELAKLYAMQRRKADCDAQFREIARRMTFDYVLAFAWGQNECQVWDPAEAIPLLSAIVEQDPDDRLSRLALAIDYRLGLQYDQGEVVLRPLGDDDPDARAIRVQLAIDRVDFDAAEKLARE
jgi:tetratricopeptide (TPR) repeat protein